jgi:hypothetical protein
MAFQTNAARANDNNTRANDESWKAQGFINLYLPTADGGKKKLGAIPLRKANPNEAKLAKWLEEDIERVHHLLSKVIMEYNSAEPKAGSEFDLG